MLSTSAFNALLKTLEEPPEHVKFILATTDPRLFANGAERERFLDLEGAVRLSRYGTDCYAYCMLAAGQIDLVIEAGLKPYDIVALIPVVEGAGGVVNRERLPPPAGSVAL